MLKIDFPPYGIHCIHYMCVHSTHNSIISTISCSILQCMTIPGIRYDIPCVCREMGSMFDTVQIEFYITVSNMSLSKIFEKLATMLHSDVWSPTELKGDLPLPTSDFTFTKVDRHRAALFGGSISGEILVNSLYIFNFRIMVSLYPSFPSGLYSYQIL